MPFKEGNTYGLGRPKGSENKVTKASKEISEALELYVKNLLPSVPNLIEELDSKDKLEFIVKLLPYAIPKKSEKHFIDESEIPEQPLFIENTMVVSNENYKKMKEEGRIDDEGNLIPQ